MKPEFLIALPDVIDLFSLKADARNALKGLKMLLSLAPVVILKWVSCQVYPAQAWPPLKGGLGGRQGEPVSPPGRPGAGPDQGLYAGLLPDVARMGQLRLLSPPEG